MPLSLQIAPLQNAAEMIRRKTPVGSAMTAAEWEQVAGEVRFRSMFSAQVEDERLLTEMQARLQARIDLAKRDGRTMDRGVFIEEMRDELRRAGYRRPDGVKRGSLRDMKSTRRLGLIWDMNLEQAQGYARWRADMTVDGLENEPCYELIRVAMRLEHRDWPTIWAQNGGQFYDGYGSNDDYPNSPGRMIALKTSDIWRKISRFGTPWPPYDWGSGMGLRGIDRSESDGFGITTPQQTFIPQNTPFNDNLQASVAGINDDGRARLLESFQGEVELVSDTLRVLPPPAAVPSVVMFPTPITHAMRLAAETLAKWPEKQLQKFAEIAAKTLAWPRYRAAVETAQTHEMLVRALAQFLADPEARNAIAQIRRTSSRDAFWCSADFADIEAFLTRGGVL